MIDLTPALEQASDDKEVMNMLGYLMFGDKWKEIENGQDEDSDN